jgi:hypothetical protein
VPAKKATAKKATAKAPARKTAVKRAPKKTAPKVQDIVAELKETKAELEALKREDRDRKGLKKSAADAIAERDDIIQRLCDLFVEEGDFSLPTAGPLSVTWELGPNGSYLVTQRR